MPRLNIALDKKDFEELKKGNSVSCGPCGTDFRDIEIVLDKDVVNSITTDRDLLYKFMHPKGTVCPTGEPGACGKPSAGVRGYIGDKGPRIKF